MSVPWGDGGASCGTQTRPHATRCAIRAHSCSSHARRLTVGVCNTASTSGSCVTGGAGGRAGTGGAGGSGAAGAAGDGAAAGANASSSSLRRSRSRFASFTTPFIVSWSGVPESMFHFLDARTTST